MNGSTYRHPEDCDEAAKAKLISSMRTMVGRYEALVTFYKQNLQATYSEKTHNMILDQINCSEVNLDRNEAGLLSTKDHSSKPSRA